MFDAERTATMLLKARQTRRMSDRLPDGPGTHAEAVAAQVAMARRVGAFPPAGFKIGATSATMQRHLGVPGPMAGFMAGAGLHGSGSTLRWDGFFNPGVECELAVVLARPLAGPCTPEDAAAAVGQLMAAIEVVEHRGASEPLGMVADQVFHAAAVLGEPLEGWRDLDLLALPGRLTVDGVDHGGGVGADLLGGPMQALAWLAGSAEAAAFGGLQAGQLVMLGSVIPPVWLDGPARVRVSFGAGVAEVELV